MPRPVILIADNDSAFLNGRVELLERAGYDVVTATNPAEVWERLSHGGVDLAILDIRLEDDHDADDRSGLRIAREAAPMTPKIILTNFADVPTVREALSSTRRRRPAAVDVISKDEPFETLDRVIKAILTPRDVFIVHGHDPIVENVALLIERLGLRAVILREMADPGMTIIESLERHSRVAFAVVLLTPDDMGYPKGHPEKLQGRARQNVIFELGYFVAKLGRAQVSVLLADGVEMLSNFSGVRDVPIDAAGAWKHQLGRQLIAAGLDVDLNDIR